MACSALCVCTGTAVQVYMCALKHAIFHYWVVVPEGEAGADRAERRKEKEKLRVDSDCLNVLRHGEKNRLLKTWSVAEAAKHYPLLFLIISLRSATACVCVFVCWLRLQDESSLHLSLYNGFTKAHANSPLIQRFIKHLLAVVMSGYLFLHCTVYSKWGCLCFVVKYVRKPIFL